MGQGPEDGTRGRKDFARDCLKKLGNPKEWAEILGFSASYVRKLIRGERPILIEYLEKISIGTKHFARIAKALDDWADRELLMNYPTDRGRF